MAIPPVPTRQLFIDGEWREPILKNRIPIVNPSTQDVIGHIPAATKEDVEVAVNAARRAFSRNKGKDWAKAPGALRAKYLRAIAAKVTERKSHLATLESLDSGKPLDETVWDMEDVAGCFEFYADLAEGLDAKQKAPVSLPMEMTTVESGTRALQYLGLDGDNGSSALKDLKVNLIVTDYSMPGLTGYELLKKIKESSAFREIPVVIMSSENIQPRIEQCMTEGAEDFLLKPVKLADVKRLTELIMRSGEPQEEDKAKHSYPNRILQNNTDSSSSSHDDVSYVDDDTPSSKRMKLES
ncbi:hypothetical protein F2Q68_00045533 [Brassica cretica]|uniref:aminobutyraldehyde dehydrogenase n=1 Tax=Brassica cretica TaxID=69181 RepID=A0A8S9LS74_BRACR|nr:hypothetical protein F2Q68_00045533 [Brassica cretica]